MDADEQRQRQLTRMKLVATSLLALATVVYALTVHRDGWLGFVNSGAEAAMIGAVADWFAVTALFRHPLGLPIPHTAIIPRRKDALGVSLQEFVAENFLSAEVVRGRLATVEVSRRVGGWLREDPNAERVVGELAQVARGTMTVLRDEHIVTLLDQVLLRRVMERPWSPSAGRLLQRVVADGAHHRLVDITVESIYHWVAQHQETIEDLVLDRAPSWTPSWVDQRVAHRAYVEVLNWAEDVHRDPEHRVRKAVDDMLSGFGEKLQTDPETMAKALEFQGRMTEHPQLREALTQLWVSVRAVLEEAIDDPASDLRARMHDGLVGFGRRLNEDPDLQKRVDGYVMDALSHMISRYRGEVATVISETVARWDADDASRKIELHVGRDLQFIRINGTVVGGLAGLAIHTVTVLAG